MSQYSNQTASGTMMQSQRGPEPLDNVIERVMAIANRLVAAENVIKSQVSEVASLKQQISHLETKIENVALKASGQEFKKPTTRKSTQTTES